MAYFLNGRIPNQQKGNLYAHASIWSEEVLEKHFLRIVSIYYTFTTSICSLFSGAEWRILFWSYIRQTCSLRYEGISTINVLSCGLAVALERIVFPFVKQCIEDKMTVKCFATTVPHISRTFFEHQEKVSTIMFRSIIILYIFEFFRTVLL